MKQIAQLSRMATITLLTSTLALTACTSNNTTSTNSSSDPSSQSSSTASEEVQKPTPKDDKKAYANALEDYQKIMQHSATYPKDLSHIKELLDNLSIELNPWVVESALFQPKQLRYTFLDLNKDGKNELLVGTMSDSQQVFPVALYYLNNDAPALLAQSFVAGNGGARNTFTIYQNGDVVSASWSSGTGAGTATLYQFPTGNSQPKQANQSEFQLGQDTLDQLFGKSKAEELDLSSLKWETFEAPQKVASATDTTAKSMDINTVASGDFTSLAGTWKNGQGKMLTIKADGTITYPEAPDSSNYINLERAKVQDGQLYASITNPNAMASATFPTVFIPKGVAITPIAENGNDPTDKSKDRLFSTQYIMPADVLAQEVYYRVE